MGQKVTLGGNRLGSGQKNKVYLHNYERSTHNLSQKFTSSIGVGMLVPFMCIPVTRDDKFEIDLAAGLRTIPTKGPMFGSFKLQVDVFTAPWRLYQALLHNNPLAIGLKANQVKFPKMVLGAWGTQQEDYKNRNNTYIRLKAARNSLVKYLGIDAIGNVSRTTAENDGLVFRRMTASHLLAYYDIFKNFYANKQEENAYTLASEFKKTGLKTNIGITYVNAVGGVNLNYTINDIETTYRITILNNSIYAWHLQGTTSNTMSEKEFLLQRVYIRIKNKASGGTPQYIDLSGTIQELLTAGFISNAHYYNNKNWEIFFNGQRTIEIEGQTGIFIPDIFDIPKEFSLYNDEAVLKPFPLSNIDLMRQQILSFHNLGESFELEPEIYEPYRSAIGTDDITEEGLLNWQKPLAGLCVKTYQSDYFNNWINTEWIDGDNGIAAITAISTSEGKITVDALQFSEKLYNLLNRIAVKGNTYEDYLDAAYTASTKKFCETPMWVGGFSDEIVFEEIIQSAPTDDKPLGTLGGRGNLRGKHKGGKITVKIDEPSWIIGIVSITPRIQYTQGIQWFNTEIDSLQDLHVPALDGIAFQNLLAEQMLGESTEILADGEIGERAVVGKVPAWLHYMTAVDRAYGDFAATEGDGYMILNRNYEFDNATGELVDATTYIDPAKFNYAFAYTKRDAQNFWIQIYSDIMARRLMSAKQIPTA